MEKLKEIIKQKPIIIEIVAIIIVLIIRIIVQTNNTNGSSKNKTQNTSGKGQPLFIFCKKNEICRSNIPRTTHTLNCLSYNYYSIPLFICQYKKIMLILKNIVDNYFFGIR